MKKEKWTSFQFTGETVTRRAIIVGVSAIISLILGLAINYLALPSQTIHSSEWWCFWIAIGIIFTVSAVILQAIFNKIRYEEEKPIIGIICGIFTAIIVAVMFVTSISGWKCSHADKYANLIKIEEGDFEKDIPQMSDEAVIVDMKTAQRLGDRTIGTIKHASWYEADDEYDLIEVNGEYYRISSVKYNDIFAYWKASSEGIPGYILVNAKTQEAKYVPLEEGMKYAPSAFFSYDLSRHLHKQHPDYMYGKSFFEIDDEGNPYWITGAGTATIGMRGAPMINTIVITSAITGESEEHPIDDVPEWVDHAYSVDYMMTRIGWHYRYQEGWWNPSKTNMYRTAYYYKSKKGSEEENEFTPFDGYNSMVDSEGNIWFNTGITPANAAETNVGFILISPKTGKVKFYQCEGAEESSAQAAAEGLVQNLGYSASFPNMVNVDGMATYFMVLKDNAGLVQRYALCNVAQYSKVVQAETIGEALEAYRRKMNLITTEDLEEEEEPTVVQRGETLPEVEHEVKKTTGKVSEVTEAQIEGYTFYYFTIEESESIFMSSIKNSNLQPLKLKVGTEVSVMSYTEKEVEIVTEITIK